MQTGAPLTVSTMHVIQLFDENGHTSRWLASISFDNERCSNYLAYARPNQEVFISKTMCGAAELIRKECILEWDVALGDAVQWFLLNGNQNPTQIWLEFESAIKT